MQLFESLARGSPQLRAWLLSELEAKHKVLVSVTDVDQLRRAQGYAQCLQAIVGHLDSALSPRPPAHIHLK